MTHSVLDGLGSIRKVRSLGTGSDADPLVLVSKRHSNALVDDGKLFIHYDRHSIANNGIFYYMLRTSASMQTTLYDFDVSCTVGPFYVDLYENTVVSANGTTESLFNQNRNSTTTASSVLYENPTVTSNGTSLIEYLVAGDKGNGTYKGTRFILKQSTNYLMRFENKSGAASIIAITVRISET